MPAIGTRGAASARGFGLFSSLGGPYWIATLGGSSTDYGLGIAIDGAGNVYTAGYTFSSGAGGVDALISKYNTYGVIQWQRTLGGSGTDYGYGVAVDTSGNVYVTGYTNNAGAGGDEILIFKYNTTGTLQWQRVLGGTGNEYGYGIAVDSSSNLYVAAHTINSGGSYYDVLTTKYDSSGTIQWQRTLGNSNGDDYGIAVAVDTSNNVYVTGFVTSAGSGIDDYLIAKYNSSGTIQWQRVLGGVNSEYGQGIAVDASGNVYVTGYTNGGGSGGYDILTAKYDTNGSIQWQRLLGGAGNDYAFGISVDGAGNAYIAGYTTSTGAGSDDVLLAKYNTSGTLQWQRTLGTTGSDTGYDIAVDKYGTMHVTGLAWNASSSSNDMLIAKLPGDGSKTGTYGPWTYQACSLTASTASFTDLAAGMTTATSSFTSSTSSLTSATSSLTSTVTNV